MNRTKIEWVKNPDGSPGYTWNPLSGCENHTPEGLCLGGLFPCYAWKLAHGRLKPLYLANVEGIYIPASMKSELVKAAKDPFYPRFWEERLGEIIPKKGSHLFPPRQRKGIFVGDTGDLFGIGVPEQWTRRVLAAINKDFLSGDRFYLLTKQPQNLIKFSPFPENCWVGVTATNGKMVDDAGYYLEKIEAKVKFLSIEPLLEPMLLFFGKPTLDWLIIGACTGSWKDMVALSAEYPELAVMKWGKKWTAQPRTEWVREIVEAADKAGIKVFLKDNLAPLIKWFRDSWAFEPSSNIPRQEMPINISKGNTDSQ